MRMTSMRKKDGAACARQLPDGAGSRKNRSRPSPMRPGWYAYGHADIFDLEQVVEYHLRPRELATASSPRR